MRKSINVWTEDFTEFVTSETRPVDSDGYAVYHPVVNFRRVTGSSYKPYTAGSEEWRKAANRVLAQEAQDNFARLRGWRW